MFGGVALNRLAPVGLVLLLHACAQSEPPHSEMEDGLQDTPDAQTADAALDAGKPVEPLFVPRNTACPSGTLDVFSDAPAYQSSMFRETTMEGVLGGLTIGRTRLHGFFSSDANEL